MSVDKPLDGTMSFVASPGKGMKMIEEWLNPMPVSDLDMWSNESGKDKRVKNLLLRYQIKLNRLGTPSFWPEQLLRQILDKDSVEELITEALVGSNDHDLLQDLTEKVWTRYHRMFIVLILSEKPNAILDFVKHGVTDDKLPLPDNFFKSSGDTDLFQGWEEKDVEDFSKQYQLSVSFPFLEPHKDLSDIPEFEILEDVSVPWIEVIDTAEAEPNRGAYGLVAKIAIHPWQHGFHDISTEVGAPSNYFALKKFTGPNSSRNWKTELENLKCFYRWNNHKHHVIKALAAVENKNRDGGSDYYVLFPWAECNLLEYWRQNKVKKYTQKEMAWISEQCLGIIGAVNSFHNPPEEAVNDKGQALYGAHNDIKAENILLFRNKDGRPHLVLADCGLSATHREDTRSNQYSNAVTTTPNYRPPECDIEANCVSRALDVWALGCMFLEFVVWILKGRTGLQDFRSYRNVSYAKYHNSHSSDIYFEVLELPKPTTDNQGNDNAGKARYGMQVKERVQQMILELHKDRHCTQWIHDWLDLVQDKMLVVFTSESTVKRIDSMELERQFKKLHVKCAKSRDYVERANPEERIAKPRAPIEVTLNAKAMRQVGR